MFGNPGRFGFASGDEVSEAFISYGSRLDSIVCKAGTLGSKKDAYIHASLRYVAKTVQRSLRRKDRADTLLHELHGEGSPRKIPVNIARQAAQGKGPDPDDRDFISRVPTDIFFRRLAAPEKRILFLALKCAWEIDDALAEQIAHRLGIPLAHLQSLLQRAKLSVEPARLCREKLDSYLNTTWYRLKLVEMELNDDSILPERRKTLAGKARRYRARHADLLARKSSQRILVSNRAIALILGIPKGSVDSGMHYLKRLACPRL
jgi:hypothetical protein